MGTSWDGMLGLQQNIATAAYTVNARTFAIAGGNLLALWEYADQDPDPTNVAWSQFDVILGWASPDLVFTPNSQSANDWDVVEVSTDDLRVVRRALDGSYDHLRYDGTTWTVLPPPPNDPGLAESGVVLLANAPHVAVLAIGSDAATSVRMVVWDGTTWGAWSTLEGSPVSRRYLSAWSSPGHTAVLWTQAGGQGLEIAGTTVAF
jgi:hypothetical protein